MSTRISDALAQFKPPEGVAVSERPPFDEEAERRDLMARIAAGRLRKAGLRGAYASADCELGREAWERALAGRGTYLWGEPGRGKTWAAACCVRLAVEAGGKVKLTTSKALLDAVKAEYDGGERDVIKRAEQYDLLALDDLGLERPTEWAMETLSALIDARVSAGRPTVVTSNYSLGQLGKHWGGGVGAARVASRLGGACERIEVKGRDRRLSG